MRLGKLTITSFFLLALLSFSHSVLAVATPTGATHETLNQQDVTVTFTENIQFTGSTTAGWTVDLDGTTATIILVTPVLNQVIISFIETIDFIQTANVTVDYDDGPGTLQSAIDFVDVVSFNIPSVNNFIIVCADYLSIASQGPIPPESICAAVDPLYFFEFQLSQRARNSTDFGSANLQVRVQWMDPGMSQTTYTLSEPVLGSGTMRGESTTGDGFTYPPNDPECSYIAEFFPRVDGGGCQGNPLLLGTQRVLSYNTDDSPAPATGMLVLDPTVVNGDQVCFQENLNLTFSDMSVLNCTVAAEPTFPNQLDRWVRFVYGDPTKADVDRIPNVEIDGVPITDATGALLPAALPNGYINTGYPGSDAIGVVNLPPPVLAPSLVSDLITSSDTVGQNKLFVHAWVAKRIGITSIPILHKNR